MYSHHLQTIKREVNYYKSTFEILDFKQEAAQQEKKKKTAQNCQS